jgi:hypothetical protein
MDLSSHRQSVARALGALETSLDRLVAALAHGAVSIQLEPSASNANAIRRACEAYSAIDYQMEDRAGESVVCLGVIGAGAEVMRLAEAVNVAKAELKAICAPLRRVKVRVPVKGEASATRAIQAIRVLLRSIQRSDLNLLAAYRKIPLLGAPPVSVTYTRANTRAVYRKPVYEIEEMLATLEGPTALADRERLAALPRGETHLALAKERYPNIRANILYAHLDPRGRGRIQISAELPVLYPRGRRATPPEVHFPREQTTDEPPRLRQSKLEPHPFLESLPVYRYARVVM